MASSPSYRLVLRHPDGQVTERTVDGPLVLGRHPGVDLVVDDAEISRRHARFHPEGDALVVEDLGSFNGVEIAGRRIEGPTRVAGGTALTLGSCRVEIRGGDDEPGEDRVELVGLDPPIRHRRYRLAAGSNLIGRAEGCAVEIRDPTLSRRHALVEVEPEASGAVTLRDLGSANGSFLGWRRVRRAELEDGDRVRVGDVRLAFETSRVASGRPGRRRSQWAPRWGALALALAVAALEAVGVGWLLGLEARSLRAAPAATRAPRPEAGGRARALESALEADERATARRIAEAWTREDPVHPAPRRALSVLRARAAADALLEGASSLEAAGDAVEAHRSVAFVPASSPAGARAAAMAARLGGPALRQAVERARAAAAAGDEAGLRRALDTVLDIDPAHEEARRLSARLAPRRARASAPAARRARSDPSGPVAEVLDLYRAGRVADALVRARSLMASAAPEPRATLERFVQVGHQILRRYPRVRRDTVDDPDLARRRLAHIEALEARILPRGSRSFVVRELRADLVAAYVQRAERALDEQRWEQAALQVRAAEHLEVPSERLAAARARLDRAARLILQRAERAAREGAHTRACEGFRRAIELLRAGAPAANRARSGARFACERDE